LLNVRQAAVYLNVTERWIKRAVAERRIPYTRTGRLIQFKREDLDSYVEGNMVYPDSYADRGERVPAARRTKGGKH
jgi:excisionase family DNA binding protein